MTINRDWILARLTGRHGEKTKLADAMGIKTDMLSKILSGVRQLSPYEADMARRFFGEDQTLTPEEEDMLALFRMIPKGKRSAAKGMFQALADQEASDEDADAVTTKAVE